MIFSVADKISVGWRGLISERDRGIGGCEDPLMLPSPSSRFYPPNEIRCLHLALICLFLSSDKKIRTCMLGLLKYSVASKRYISIVAIKRSYYRQKQGIVASKQALLDLEYVTLPEVNKLFIFLFVRFIIKLACRVYQCVG